MNYQIGRKDIDTWMKTGNITNMEDVKTELRKRYLRNVENAVTSLHIEVSTSTTLDTLLELPTSITSVVFMGHYHYGQCVERSQSFEKCVLCGVFESDENRK